MEKIKAILETAVLLDINGAKDALDEFNEIMEELETLQDEAKAIKKSLKRIKKAFD